MLSYSPTSIHVSQEFKNAMCLAWVEAMKLARELGGADLVVSDKMHKLDRMLSVQENQEFKEYLASAEFSSLCTETFAEFDVDRSGTLDAGELLNAFNAVLKRMPGLDEKLAEFGDNLDTTSELIFTKKLASEFESVDVDGNGELDEKEFPAAMRIMYIEAVRLLHQSDSNVGEERVRKIAEAVAIDIGVWEPLEQLLLHFQAPHFDSLCERIWQTYDRNQTGSIDQAELHDAAEALLAENKDVLDSLKSRQLDIRLGIRSLGAEIVRKVFAWIDVDENGVLDQNEFPYAIMIFYLEALRVCKKKSRKFSEFQSSSSESGGGLFSFKRQKQNNEPRKIITNLLLKLGEKDHGYAQYLQGFFYSAEFEQSCLATFQELDEDKSQSIDRNELYGAFEKLVNDIPGTIDRFTQIGVNPIEQLQNLGVEIVAQVFVHADASQSGKLDLRQFADAVKMVWLKLALAQPTSGSSSN
jgi:Ca2+-binding EF-hand superfamily protein